MEKGTRVATWPQENDREIIEEGKWRKQCYTEMIAGKKLPTNIMKRFPRSKILKRLFNCGWRRWRAAFVRGGCVL